MHKEALDRIEKRPNQTDGHARSVEEGLVHQRKLRRFLKERAHKEAELKIKAENEKMYRNIEKANPTIRRKEFVQHAKEHKFRVKRMTAHVQELYGFPVDERPPVFKEKRPMKDLSEMDL
jgi:hypothetical protein